MARGRWMLISFLPSSLSTAFCSPELKPRASAHRKLGLPTVNIIKTSFSCVVHGPTWSNLTLLGYLSLCDLPRGAVLTVKMSHHAHLLDSWGTDLLREVWFGKDGPGFMWFAVENISKLIFSSALVNNLGWSPDNGKASNQSSYLWVGDHFAPRDFWFYEAQTFQMSLTWTLSTGGRLSFEAKESKHNPSWLL